ncbi:unnamed protein product [Brassica rapa]|uniref:Uncharacterized protein n=2 Tax=Brassica campestris TaxID=3711 RepID=A0A8D9HC06_BRACM|nr:unnamed protein product [Brassica rapa]
MSKSPLSRKSDYRVSLPLALPLHLDFFHLSSFIINNKSVMYAANLVIMNFDRSSAVCVEDMGDSSIGAFIENGGDDDDIGHGYACMIHLTHQM